MKKYIFLFLWALLSLHLAGQTLVSGCYYVKEKSDSTLLVTGAKDTVWIDPKPIISVNDFKKIKLVKDNYGDALDITLSREGAEKFRLATAAWVSRKIAIVVRNEVVSAPTVVSEIAGGRVRITSGLNTDMRLLRSKLEEEKKNAGH